MEAIIDKVTILEKMKYLLDWLFSKNRNIIDFPFTCFIEHPEIVTKTKTFFVSPEQRSRISLCPQ